MYFEVFNDVHLFFFLLMIHRGKCHMIMNIFLKRVYTYKTSLNDKLLGIKAEDM